MDSQELEDQLMQLENLLGYENVKIPPNKRWVQIDRFPLPENYNVRSTAMLIEIPNPEKPGFVLEGVYLNPNIKINKEGVFVYLPRYYEDVDDPKNRFSSKGWRYLQLHSDGGNLVEYVETISRYLREPWTES